MSKDIFEEEEQIAQEQASVEAHVLRQTIRELPTLQPPITCERSATIRQAIEVMQRERIDCMLVVDLGRLVGIFTAWDVLTKVAARGVDIDHLQIGMLMTPNPDCLHMDDELAYALNQMSVWDYQHIPLIDDQGRPTGVVSMRHIIDYLVAMFPQDVFNLPRPHGTALRHTRKVRKDLAAL
jgi:CBS domain-containing protein